MFLDQFLHHNWPTFWEWVRYAVYFFSTWYFFRQPSRVVMGLTLGVLFSMVALVAALDARLVSDKSQWFGLQAAALVATFILGTFAAVWQIANMAGWWKRSQSAIRPRMTRQA